MTSSPFQSSPTPALAASPRALAQSWMWPLILAVPLFFIVHPFDASLSHAAAKLVAPGGAVGGDLRRELFAWQQYGQGFAIAVIALAIFLQDRANRVRLFDLALAALLAQIASTAGKLLIGRPRPRDWYDDPHTFLGPFGEYPIRTDSGWKLVHAWDKSGGANTDLWSMPSSHTLFAAMLSAFLAILYPRLRWVVIPLAVIVGLGRVLFDAHWPTDVIVGGAIGASIGLWVAPTRRGVHLARRLGLAKAPDPSRSLHQPVPTQESPPAPG